MTNIHIGTQRPPVRKRLHSVLFATLAAVVVFPSSSAFSQSFESIENADTPLTLKSRGSFYVGGETVEQTQLELGGRGPADSITINQMYVEYMVPGGQPKIPAVMIHGATLTGKSWDTTPDGRMGWYEYFVRQAHPTYLVDQVGRGRSGFNQAELNRMSAGQGTTEASPKAFRFGDRNGAWTNFRFGPKAGEAFPEEKFPVAAVGELAKQSIPDLSALVQTPSPTIQGISDLATKLKGAVLISHSQSGHFPLEAALVNHGGDIRGIVALEPGRCRGSEYTDAQIAELAKVPTLVMFGDNLPSATNFPGQTWQERYDDCKIYVQRITAAKGDAQLVQTTELGVRGNSHMLMQDSNSIQLADYVLKWIDTHTKAASKN